MRARDKTMPAQEQQRPARVSSWQARLSSPAGVSLLLALATLAVFWSVTRLGFVNYDDPTYVYENVHLQSGLTWENLRWAFTNLDADVFRRDHLAAFLCKGTADFFKSDDVCAAHDQSAMMRIGVPLSQASISSSACGK